MATLNHDSSSETKHSHYDLLACELKCGVYAMCYLHCFLSLSVSFVLFFFFSSRRRHTRLQGDWSSDVCSSDLTLTSRSGFARGLRTARRGERARIGRAPRLRPRRSPPRGRQSVKPRSATVRIAAGQGFWGDWLEAPYRQVPGGPADYPLVAYLAAVTMSIC